MSDVAVPSQLAPSAERDAHGTPTGVSNMKLMIWLFLASDCLFFGAVISTFLLYRNREVTTGPQAKNLREVLDIPFTSTTSFILLMSSLTMVLALAAIQRGDHRRVRIWLLATALFGLTFIAGQIFEFTQFARDGFRLDSSPGSGAFFVLTGLHGAHVTVGIIWLLSLWGLSNQGRLLQEHAEKVEVAGLYWHFVDVVWIVLFTLVYLMPQ